MDVGELGGAGTLWRRSGNEAVAGDGLEDDVEFVCEPKFIYFRAICRS